MTTGLEFTPYPSPVRTLGELQVLIAARRVTYFGLAKSRTGWVWSTELRDEPRGYYSTGHATLLDAMSAFCAYLGGAGGDPQGCCAAGHPGPLADAPSAHATCAQ